MKNSHLKLLQNKHKKLVEKDLRVSDNFNKKSSVLEKDKWCVQITKQQAARYFQWKKETGSYKLIPDSRCHVTGSTCYKSKY